MQYPQQANPQGQKQVSVCQALGEGREGLADNRQCFRAEKVLEPEVEVVG